MSPSQNKSNLITENLDSADANWQTLFGLSFVIAAVICVGGLYSLGSLLRMRTKSSICLIVASLSIDDLISLVPLALFMALQWRRDSRSGTICTLSGLLYVFQGLSSNMKACLIVAYTFYVTKRFGVYQSSSRPRAVLWAVAVVWTVSLAVSVLPVCGWGRFAPASLGCLPESDSFYVLLLFVLYSLCFCCLVVCSVPLTYQLLCSPETLKAFYPSYFEIGTALSADGSAPLCEIPSLSRDSLEKSFGAYGEFSSHSVGVKSKDETYSCSSPKTDRFEKLGALSARHSPVVFAQKRFSMILAMARIVLWMPMMAQILMRHAVQMHSASLETLCFFLTLLSAAVTPVFVLSERWIHLPCGCFINCRRGDVGSVSAATHKRRFEFNLSLQQGYGIYKIPHASSPSAEKPSYNSLYDCDFSESRLAALDGGQVAGLSGRDFSTAAADSSLHGELRLLDDVSRVQKEGGLSQPNSEERDGFVSVSPPVSACDGEDLNLDSSSVFDGPERRLSHEECRKIELSDWEWCRSKSERTPRQRSAGGLAIPLCAIQGTVSLHAPTGKTLSLSTYEVSSDGLKISPNGARKVEVYRSKSVGHEPSAEEPAAGGAAQSGGGVADTNVKIHLEVLEICDNEEAMDSVSIVSNISQSSTHARSPSLRYSRRENRFVSCDLGETASYSLLIPGSSPDADGINIHIPDTVEAHRQNSRRQRQDAGGYREEIQLLNEVYQKQAGDDAGNEDRRLL